MDVVNSDQAEPTSNELKPITVENLEVDFLPIIYDIIRRYVCCFIEVLQYLTFRTQSRFLITF